MSFLGGTWRDEGPTLSTAGLLGESGDSGVYTSLADEDVGLRKPLVTSRSMAKVYFTHNVGTTRLSKLMRLPRFQSVRNLGHPEGFQFPTRTRALGRELQKACDYFATVLTLMGLRPGDNKRFGSVFTLFVLILLGVAWPLFDLFCAKVVVSDNKLRGLIDLASYYRLLVYIVSLVWLVRVSRRWNVKALLFLKVDKLYLSRIAQEKGLGGMWVYAAIIQNFALEVMCLFVPYFVVICFAKAWWFFNSLSSSKLYSSSYEFGNYVLMDSKSPLYVKMLFYFAGLLSQSYMQIVYIVPCVYFRMVATLILLEMKAYKAMVQPERGEEEKDRLSELLKEDVSSEHPIPGNGSTQQPIELGNSFASSPMNALSKSSWTDASGDAKKSLKGEEENSMRKFELEEVPPAQRKEDSVPKLVTSASLPLPLPQNVSLIQDARGLRRRASIFHRYGANPFGMYVESNKLEDADNLDNELTDSEEEEELKHHMEEQSFPVLREHSLLQKVLRLISHRFRQFLLISFILIFFESFGTLYFLLNAMLDMDAQEKEHYSLTGMIVRLEISSSALLHIVGLVLNIRAILIMTHRLRAVHTIASEQHAHLTCKMNLMNAGDDQKELLVGLGREFEQYMKRQSLLQYMVNHPLGITIYGFIIDREFLRSFHMVVVSLAVFLVSMIMGGSHSKSSS